MEFAREPYSDKLVEEMMPLWREHYQEIANEFYGPLEPNLDLYKHLDEIGVLRIFTVREAGKLFGYQIFMVMGHPHSRNWKVANQDILFLDKDSRKGMTGYSFIKWCTEQLQKEEIRCIFQHISADFDFGELLKRMGYKHCDQVYALGGV